MSEDTPKISKASSVAGVFAVTAIALLPLALKKLQGKTLYVDETCPSLIAPATDAELEHKRAATTVIESVVPAFVPPAP